jgi:hypothetical protein
MTIQKTIEFCRKKLRQHYLSLFGKLHKIKAAADGILKSLPFIFARAIRNMITDKIRFGEQLLRIHDEDLI